MKPQIVVLDGYTLTPNITGHPAAAGEPTWDALGELGQLTVYPRTRDEAVSERIEEASLVLTNKTGLTRETLSGAANLRYIGVMATGMNVIDLGAADEFGIVVKNAPGYGTQSVAQHVFALILELSNRVGAHSTSVQRGDWSACPDFCYTVGPLVELKGKTLGVVGMGSIGQRVAALGHAFGLKIAASHQRSMNEVSLPGIEIQWMPIDALVAEADVLTLHCPLTDETDRIINADRLNRMKPGTMLINTGRGLLIDEDSLAAALSSGQIAGAGLDVLSLEPPHSDHPLLNCPNCVVTPHIAWATRESRRRLMDIVVENVRVFLDGRSYV